MAEVVADLFERQPLSKQMRRTCVTQGVWSIVGGNHTQPSKAFTDDWPQIAHRLNRGGQGQKHFPVRRARTHLCNVAQNGIAHALFAGAISSANPPETT